MEIDVAVSKINKTGTPESSDTIEFIERPLGGLSVVMANVIGQGMEKKSISATVVRKVISWIGEGVRDGAAARAASDYLFTEHKGAINACLNIVSFDKQSDTIVVTRNNPSPIFIYRGEELNTLSGQSDCIGSTLNIRPLISEIPLAANTLLVLYSIGVENAGKSIHQTFDGCMIIRSLLDEQEPTAQEITNTLLQEAIRMDQNTPKEDMTIVAARILPDSGAKIRKMSVFFPFSNKIDESQID
ncbi:MAG: SpoIIE family protein phosphatase [Anaerolineaceae bacterium]|nr:SpoIIE family protein phosphatase [Anaerolineaceae bacterium]